MRLLSVDVDLVCCPSDKAWDEWLRLETFKHFLDNFSNELTKYPWDYMEKTKGALPYNLAELYPYVKDPMSFWRELDYSTLTPIEGSVEALQELSKHFGITFLSSCKGGHFKSKYYWLEKHYPFLEGFLATKKKYLVNDSVVAHTDDRLDMLAGFDLHKRVLYETPYTQSVSCPVGYKIKSWESLDVGEFIDYLLGG